MSRASAALAIALAAGCGASEVEIEPLPADYAAWHRTDATGAVGGHGDSYRIIYVNDIAHAWSGAGAYPLGSVIAKEVRQRAPDGGPGELSYMAVMRRLDQAPPGGALDGGWLFTYLGDGAESPEEHRLTCWPTCHVAAPFAGSFLHHGSR